MIKEIEKITGTTYELQEDNLNNETFRLIEDLLWAYETLEDEFRRYVDMTENGDSREDYEIEAIREINL